MQVTIWLMSRCSSVFRGRARRHCQPILCENWLATTSMVGVLTESSVSKTDFTPKQRTLLLKENPLFGLEFKHRMSSLKTPPSIMEATMEAFHDLWEMIAT